MECDFHSLNIKYSHKTSRSPSLRCLHADGLEIIHLQFKPPEETTWRLSLMKGGWTKLPHVVCPSKTCRYATTDVDRMSIIYQRYPRNTRRVWWQQCTNNFSLKVFAKHSAPHMLFSTCLKHWNNGRECPMTTSAHCKVAGEASNHSP